MKTTMNRSWFGVVKSPTVHVPAIAQTNHELVEEYLTWKRTYSKAAYRSYRVWVTRFQNFVNKPPEMMTHTDYGAYAQSLQGHHAPRCIQYALSVVHNYLRFFAEQGRLHFPLYLARVPNGYVQSHEAVTENEYKIMIAIMRAQKPQSLRDLAIVMLLHDTGMRIGELVALEVEDMEEDCSAVIRTEKTVRERRVFWNHDTDEVLQRYIIERVNEGPVDVHFLCASVHATASRLP
jgi:site-specific recombinase XerD